MRGEETKGEKKKKKVRLAALLRLISETAGNNRRMLELGTGRVGSQVSVSSLSRTRCSDLQTSNMTGGFREDKRIQGRGLDLSQK